MPESPAFYKEIFATRHIGPDTEQTKKMLETLNVSSLDELIEKVVPQSIRLKQPLAIPNALSEVEFLAKFKVMGAKNKMFRSFIGTGYYGTLTPTPILRNVLENPAWYTAYTPYQAEIAQGRMEALINFQTLVMDLTQMEIANASLLDEATAVAESVHLMYAVKPASKANSKSIFISDKCHPQTIELVQLRSEPLNIKVQVGDVFSADLTNPDLFAIIIQYPDTEGNISDFRSLAASAKEQNLLICAATDLLALTQIEAPGTWGADVAVGSAQRFGVPMGYGGPHAAFFATKEEFKRNMPGRIIGLSIDAQGNPAYRMALQTREQHIRREKATSNICTAQVLLSVMASFYAVYHGPDGLDKIAKKILALTQGLESGLKLLGVKVLTRNYFDTLTIETNLLNELINIAGQHEVNFRTFVHKPNQLGISIDETCTPECVKNILSIFAQALGKETLDFQNSDFGNGEVANFTKRTTTFLNAPCFPISTILNMK